MQWVLCKVLRSGVKLAILYSYIFIHLSNFIKQQSCQQAASDMLHKIKTNCSKKTHNDISCKLYIRSNMYRSVKVKRLGLFRVNFAEVQKKYLKQTIKSIKIT